MNHPQPPLYSMYDIFIIMRKFIITEEERKQILSKHINATKRQYLHEQNNDEILKYQKALNMVWTNVKIEEDGVMGPETIKYIKLYQKQTGLNETGILDTETKEQLSRLLDDDGEIQKNESDKDLLINRLLKYLNGMKDDENIDAMGVAQIIYNNCAHFMNKTEWFSSRSGEPLSTKAEFAPED